MATYKRIASDGRPIEVTDTPAGLSESATCAIPEDIAEKLAELNK